MYNAPLCLAIQTISIVHIDSLLAWKQMKNLKRWRPIGKNPGGMIFKLNFVPTPDVHKAMAREVMKTGRWFSVTHPANA